VAQSGIITLNLEDYLPEQSQIVAFDLKPFLFKEMILREKDFRQAIAELDRSVFAAKSVAVFCGTEAIIPMWAYMLVGSMLEPVAAEVFFGTVSGFEEKKILEAISETDVSKYADKRVVIKGCGERPLPESAFLAITVKLRPYVKSLMYGEPCSTVPIYKKK
jgi:hypothetical protein